jgi:hypothetical protein
MLLLFNVIYHIRRNPLLLRNLIQQSLFDKLVVANQPVMKPLSFSEPGVSIRIVSLYFPKIRFNIIHLFMKRFLQVASSLQILRLQLFIHISPLKCNIRVDNVPSFHHTD